MEQRVFTGSFKRRKGGDSVLPLFPGRGKRHTVFQKLDVPGVNFSSCVG
jgi:hypothetical protein